MVPLGFTMAEPKRVALEVNTGEVPVKRTLALSISAPGFVVPAVEKRKLVKLGVCTAPLMIISNLKIGTLRAP